MHDFATETAPSKHTVPATSAANSCCAGSSSVAGTGGVPRGRGDGLAGLEHLRAQVLDRLEGADLLAELLAHPGVLHRRVEAPPGDSGGLGGGEGDHERPQPLRGEAGDHRRLERGQVPDRRTTRQVRRGARGQVGVLEGDQQHLVAANVQGVRGTGGVVDQAVGTQRERDPHLPRGNGTGQLTECHGCDRGAEQRARHQRTGSCLERDREVEQGAPGATECLGHGDPGQPHLGHCRGLLGELRRPGRPPPAGPPGCRPASSPTCRRRPPARRGRRRSRWARALPLRHEN